VDFEVSADQQTLIELCRAVAEREIRPVAQRAWDEERCPTEVLRAMGKAGLMGLLVPETWGGAEMGTVAFVAAMEEIGAADQSIASAWQAHSTIGSMPLLLFGSDDQRDRWLRPLAEGRSLGSFGLTEPGAGSDVRSISTKAIRVDGGWLINGSKTFISNAGTDMSYGVIILARTDAGDGGPRTYGNFIIERGAAGYSQGPKMRGIGWHGLDTRELFFADVFVPEEQVLGNLGSGLGQFLSVLEVGRISVAALANGLTSAVMKLALDHATTRKQFGETLSSFQSVQFKLADIATELEASRWLTYRAAQLRDAGSPFRKEAAMAKLKASRLAVQAASEAVQIFGGTGYMLDTPVARFFCDAKILEIGEGTNEIQKLVIARELGCVPG
jgi:short-chain 2-methylacyl-CoA dehydrogenase